MVSFPVQKFRSVNKFHLLIFAFISFALGDWHRKTLVQFMLQNVFPLFSSGSFMVSCLIFMSLSHFELCFVCVVRECSNFMDLHVATQLPHHLLNGLSFPHCIFLLICRRLIDHKCVDLFLGSLFCCQYHTVLITVAL